MSRFREPLPLDPESPDVDVLSEPVAGLLRSLCGATTDRHTDSTILIPTPKSLRWADLEVECDDTSWVLDGGSLELHLRRPRLDGDEQLARMFNVLNKRASILLRDGSALSARRAHLSSRSDNVDFEKRVAVATYTLTLDSWTWWPASSHLWFGRLEGSRVDDGNLVICSGRRWTATNLRLTGNYDLYLAHDRKTETTRLVVDTGGRKLEHDLLGTDFSAMEFALGRPLRLDHLIALDDRQEMVGASGLGFGGWTTRNRIGRCPVATSKDLYAHCRKTDADHLWVPLLFSRVAAKLNAEGTDSPLLTAVAAYVDSIAAGNIHVSYLLVQIALEALCAEIVRPTSGVLVSDVKKWLGFVKEHEAEIRSFATSADAADKLVKKVNSAQQAPSTDRVAAALRHFDLHVSKEEANEVARRSSAAHRYVMAAESTADSQDLADRLATVQTLLVAIIAKYVGYTGPIIGWEWIRGRHKIPDWWPWERSPEAGKRYLVTPTEGDLDGLGERKRIEQTAYFRWINRGSEHGHDIEDWLAAEQQVTRGT